MPPRKLKTVWISQDALTKGIRRVECEIWDDGWAYHPGFYLFSPKHWHETREEAIAKAKEMRTDKIKSLKTQIKKLEAMTF